MKKERTIKRISFVEKLPKKLLPPPGCIVFIDDETFCIPSNNGYTHDGASVPRYNPNDGDLKDSGRSFGRTPNGDFICPVCNKIIDRKILEGERLIDYSRDLSSPFYDTLIPYGYCPNCYTRSKIKKIKRINQS